MDVINFFVGCIVIKWLREWVGGWGRGCSKKVMGGIYCVYMLEGETKNHEVTLAVADLPVKGPFRKLISRAIL